MKNPKSNTNTWVVISPSSTLAYLIDTDAANFQPASYWYHTGTKKLIWKKKIKTLPKFLNIKNWYQEPPGICKTWYQNNTSHNLMSVAHNVSESSSPSSWIAVLSCHASLSQNMRTNYYSLCQAKGNWLIRRTKMHNLFSN
jgi:hypothetical protein